MRNGTELSRLRRNLRKLAESDPREAAEVAFAGARLADVNGRRKLAVALGHQAIELLERANGAPPDDPALPQYGTVAARNVTIAGIAIPTFFHADVIRERLRL